MNTITTKDGTQIYYKDWGSGQPVVFSHGWPLSSDSWESQMFFLASNGYRCIAHDRRGHGRSRQPWNGNDMRTYADDLATLLDTLDLKNAVLIGFSAGGGEVARYIGRHGTKRLAKAALVSAVPPLRRKGELTVRQYIAYFLNPPELTPADIEKVEQARRTYRDDWIAAGAVKTMLDGVVEAHTAAMLAPYSDDLTKSGKLFWDSAKYQQAIAELDRRGFQIFTHAIGDRAVRLALDAYEQAQTKNHTSDARPRVEHIETITAEDIPRFGRLGVIASFQPLHAYPDDDTLKIWARNAGPDRAGRAWAWHSIEATGGRLAFGSDWPVVTLSPWPGVQNALTRQTTEGDPPGGWLPKERISLEDTMKAYTLGAAIAGRREKTEGSLE